MQVYSDAFGASSVLGLYWAQRLALWLDAPASLERERRAVPFSGTKVGKISPNKCRWAFKNWQEDISTDIYRNHMEPSESGLGGWSSPWSIMTTAICRHSLLVQGTRDHVPGNHAAHSLGAKFGRSVCWLLGSLWGYWLGLVSWVSLAHQ